MVFGPYGLSNIATIILLATSFFLTLKLKNLMGTGRDTGPVNLLLLVIGVNLILGAYLAISIYWKWFQKWQTFAQFTDATLLFIGIVLSVSTYKIYKDFEKLVKKHEPEK